MAMKCAAAADLPTGRPRKRARLGWDVAPASKAQITFCGEEVGDMTSLVLSSHPSDHTCSSLLSKGVARNASPPWREDDKDGHYVFAVGENLTSRYKIYRKMGEGTFGQVLECWDRESREMVAIKIVRAVKKYSDAAMVEIDVLQKLARNDAARKHCVQIRNWFDYRNHICIVCEKLSPAPQRNFAAAAALKSTRVNEPPPSLKQPLLTQAGLARSRSRREEEETTTMEAAKSTTGTVSWLLPIGANFFEAINLSNDLSRLRNSLPMARLLIDRAEWGRFKNKDLAVLLSQLKDTTYNAEDLLREFDDQELRQKLEKADQNIAGQLLSSSFDLVKSWITGSKTRVKEAQSHLDKALADIEGALNFMGLNVEPVQLMPETSSGIGVPQVFGRDDERDEVIEMLGVTTGRDDDRDQVIKRLGVPLTRGGRSAGATRKRAGLPSTSRAKRLKGKSTAVATDTNRIGVCVLPIVGIGGVGKTTLAQLIYNDARVKAHFDVRIWVCVSDLFDKRRITKEIIESMPWEGEFNPSGSLDALHEELTNRLKDKKFLLVLDDIWQNANAEWEAFFKPLRNGLEGSTVIVTTRFKDVAVRVSPVEPVQLEGLPDDIFWEFFQKCAFGNEHPESYPDQLLVIGKNIAKKLCGSPLAAKTLGRLLSMDLTVQHWRTIQDSELWELQHEENEILPALQLSYLYLPQKLKRCFAVCSMFPKDHSFERDEIVEFWVAQGLVAAPGGSMRPEDIGSRYLDDLRSRSLFQADPKFPGQSRYVMHDLIHDMAQSVSVDECFLMQGLSNQRIMPETVRHMSIEVDNEALSRMTCTNHLNKLHSLRFGTRIDWEMSWFNQLSNILFLSLRGCKLVKLPEGICDLNHLRHLDISSSSIKELPEKFYRLYSLQVFDARSSKLQTIHQGVTKLVSLRRLALPPSASLALSRMSELGNLSALRNLRYYTVGTNDGQRIGELGGMNQLSGSLYIKGIAKVRSTAEAAEARLIDKQYLKELVLQWQGTGCSSRSSDNGVLEALRPPPGIESLTVDRFGGDNFPPSWLNSEDVPTLRKLVLYDCQYLRCLTGIGRMQHARLPIKSLTSLKLIACRELTNVDQFLSPEYLPSIESIELCSLWNLESLPVHNFGGFVYLQELKIRGCSKLVCPGEMILPTSLRRLSVYYCGDLDKSFRRGCLENLASLTLLRLEGCRNLEYVLLNSVNTNNLKCLVLRNCSRLSSIGGSHALSSIQHVHIKGCPMLTEVQQPFEKKGLRPEEEKELLK